VRRGRRAPWWSTCGAAGATTPADRPWQRDTLVNVFSVGKAVAALCVARLVGQGALAYDEPVARLARVRGVAARRASPCASCSATRPASPPCAVLPDGSVFDLPALCAVLAAHEPWWEPGTAHGYHVNTFGVLVGELVRRATGRTLGTIVREEIAGPLDADFFIGVPQAALPSGGRVHRHAFPAPPADRGLSDAAQLMERTPIQPAGVLGRRRHQHRAVAHGRACRRPTATPRPGHRPDVRGAGGRPARGDASTSSTPPSGRGR
jgi:CubicO group peptidase (beta-lactamase class C family)